MEVFADLASRLRQHTRPEHQLLEGRLGLPGSMRGPADLVDLLVLWRQVWHGVLLTAMSRSGAANSELFGAAEQSLRLIGADLEVLAGHGFRPGTTLPVIGVAPIRADSPTALDSAPECLAWGQLYVLLGSRLGGVLMAGPVAGRCGPAGVASLSFLMSDGLDVRKSWRQFRLRLHTWSDGQTPDDRDRVVASASATFAAIDELAVAAGWHGGIRRTKDDRGI